MAKNGSKFYNKSLILPVLEMMRNDIVPKEIAKALNISQSLVGYYISKAKERGYVREGFRDTFKSYQVTQAGKNFLDRYDKDSTSPLLLCRAENIQFRANIVQMPTIPIDWNKVQMHNWVQYNSQVDQVRVRLNIGKIPTIEFLPSPVEGDDPFELFVVMVFECINVILKLNDTMGLRVGPLQLGSRGEWVVYDPVASAFCKMNGQVTYEGVAKVNASRPRAIGEFEFFDPRALLNYLLMPPRLKKVESITEKIWEGVQKLGQSKLFTYSNRVPMSSNSLGFTAWSIVPMSIF